MENQAAEFQGNGRANSQCNTLKYFGAPLSGSWAYFGGGNLRTPQKVVPGRDPSPLNVCLRPPISAAHGSMQCRHRPRGGRLSADCGSDSLARINQPPIDPALINCFSIIRAPGRCYTYFSSVYWRWQVACGEPDEPGKSNGGRKCEPGHITDHHLLRYLAMAPHKGSRYHGSGPADGAGRQRNASIKLAR